MTERAPKVTAPTAVESLRCAFLAIAPRISALNPHEAAVLQAQVYAATDEMKAAGVLIDRVIIAIKTLASDAGIGMSGHQMVEQFTRWAIDRYYMRITPRR